MKANVICVPRRKNILQKSVRLSDYYRYSRKSNLLVSLICSKKRERYTFLFSAVDKNSRTNNKFIRATIITILIMIESSKSTLGINY